jgi:hypothetical protein
MTSDTFRVRRLDAEAAKRLTVLVSVVGMLCMSAVAILAFLRMTEIERDAEKNALIAVIDSQGHQYAFTSYRASEWLADEQVYFDKLEDIVLCARGLQLPMQGGAPCWDRVFPILGKEAHRSMTAYVASFGKTPEEVAAAMSARRITVTIVSGSTKTDDGRYRLYWREVERDPLTKKIIRDEHWTGLFDVSRVAVTRQEVAALNAIGMRLEAYTWTLDKQK